LPSGRWPNNSTDSRPTVPVAALRERRNRMKVSEIMTRDVCLANPGQKLHDVAAEMKKRDIGVLPVGGNERLF
jgi:predicted transcriptional regulator